MRIFPFSIRVSLPIFLLISELPFCCFRSEMWEVSGLVPLTLEKEPSPCSVNTLSICANPWAAGQKG